MRTLAALLGVFLVLAAGYAVSGVALADDAVADDDPPAWETSASELLVDSPGADAVSGPPGDDRSNGTRGNGERGNSENPGNSGDEPGNSGDAPGNSGDAPGNSGDEPGNSGDAPGNSGDEPGNSGDAPGNSGEDGDSEDAPGNSGSNGQGQADGDDDRGEDGANDDNAGHDEGDDGSAGDSGDDGSAGEPDSKGDEQERDSEGGDSEVQESDDEQHTGQGDDERSSQGEDEQHTGQEEDEQSDGSEDPEDEREDGGVTVPSVGDWNASTSAQARFDTSLEPFTDTAITAGERIQITVAVENAGERNGTFETGLRVDGEAVASESVAVGAGETETIVFEHQFDDPGEYEIAVGETVLGTVTVSAPDDEPITPPSTDDVDGVDPTAAVDIVEATAPSDWVMEGYETTVRATVVNTANRTVTRTLTVTVDGQPVANESVTLLPSERAVVHIGFVAVDGDVAVEGVDAGRIAVSERLGAGDAIPTDTRDERGPGFGLAVLVALIVVLAGVVALDVHQFR